MKILVTNYTFSAAAKTITFGDYGSIVLDSVLLITNVTDNVIIYNFASAGLGGTVATNVLTLDYDTTSMADADDLQIFYEDTAQDFTNDPTNGTLVNLGANNDVTVASLPLPTGAATSALQSTQDTSINSLLKPASTLAAVTTLGTITNVVHIDDNAGSITVDGSVTANAGTNLNTSLLALASTQTDKSQFTKLTDGTDTALITAAGEQNVIATAQPGVDIGDVTINNASGGSAVNIQDGGNSITVDGTVAVSGTVAVTDNAGSLTVDNPTLSVVGGGVEATALRVTIASDSTGLVSVDDNGGSLTVDYATTGSGTATGALRVELPTNGTGVVGLNAGSNTIGSIASITTSVIPGTAATNLGKAIDTAGGATDTGVAALIIRDDALSTLTPVDGDYVAGRSNARGAQWIAIEDGAGGQVTTFGGGTEVAEDTAHSSGVLGGVPLSVRRDTPTSLAGSDNDYIPTTTDANGATWVSMATKLDPTNDAVAVGVTTAGGATTYHLVSAATTNATNIKASAGQVYGWYIYNSNAAARKLVFHNTAGTPTAGASVYFSLMIPAGGAANVSFAMGIPFSTGIGITTVTGLADSDSAAVAANDLIINIFYK